MDIIYITIYIYLVLNYSGADSASANLRKFDFWEFPGTHFKCITTNMFSLFSQPFVTYGISLFNSHLSILTAQLFAKYELLPGCALFIPLSFYHKHKLAVFQCPDQDIMCTF